MPHGRHIYTKASDMSKATMCAYPQLYHALPHYTFLLRCCAKFTCVNIPDQETDDQYYNTTSSIRFHIPRLIFCCTAHGRIPLYNKKKCRVCKHDSVSEQPKKIYTRKELVMMETTISNFRTSLYVIEIQKLLFHLPHVQILVINHCGDSCQTEFKRHE